VATKLEKKWQALGMTPVKEDGERVYRETVQNLILQHREALDVANESSDEAQAKEAEARAVRIDEKLQSVADADVAAAMDAIDHAASFPQVIATVGEEIREEGT
jgi:hypothetical protein